MERYDTTLIIGDAWQRSVRLTTQDDLPVDLTGYGAVWTLRANRDDEPVVTMATTTGEIVADGETVTATLLEAQTALLTPGIYHHALELMNAGGATTTLLVGRIVAGEA